MKRKTKSSETLSAAKVGRDTLQNRSPPLTAWAKVEERKELQSGYHRTRQYPRRICQFPPPPPRRRCSVGYQNPSFSFDCLEAQIFDRRVWKLASKRANLDKKTWSGLLQERRRTSPRFFWKTSSTHQNCRTKAGVLDAEKNSPHLPFVAIRHDEWRADLHSTNWLGTDSGPASFFRVLWQRSMYVYQRF